MPDITPKHRGNFCPAIGRTGVISFVLPTASWFFFSFLWVGLLWDTKNYSRGFCFEKMVGSIALYGYFYSLAAGI
jgi:hypothetical protein